MAMHKFANAAVVHHTFTKEGWAKIRTAGRKDGNLNDNLIDRASSLFGKPFNPEEYLLTHATIVASVDTEQVPESKIGTVYENGFRVNRKYQDYRITPETQAWINNNNDAWSRPTLLKSYMTFVGAQSYVEHIQVEDLSKGRIIDAVARDIGASIYTDILIANDKKHTDLITAIRNCTLNTLSMGCFLPGTQITMGDGRRIAIEDVAPGDYVLTKKGRAREVVNKQIRVGTWSVRRIQAAGVADTIAATDIHPFYVIRAPEVCGCGCGQTLSPLKDNGSPKRRAYISRRFVRGHDKRIFNPHAVYSLTEHKEKKEKLQHIQALTPEKIRADQLRVGDFLCLPRIRPEKEIDVSNGKARLLGYFLAEGSFLKRKGELTETQFNFSLAEKETYVAETVHLLQQEFPAANTPWVQERPDRNTATVHISGREISEWFRTHGGEYGNQKKLSSEVMSWPLEAHRHLLGAWINGDGHLASGGYTCGVTTSYDLACQAHLLLARCGWWARFNCKFGVRSVEIKQVINGGVVRDEIYGRLPAYELAVGKIIAHTMGGYTDKVATDNKHTGTSLKMQEDWVIFPITSIETEEYVGAVHDMEVEEDHSYIADGAVVSNCTIDFSVCTRCGHVAADEKEMCVHIKTQKGQVFYDESGRPQKIAELCGHSQVEPTGGVQFIEASWVATPAFTGAVMRNILDPTAEIISKAERVLSQPPAQWNQNRAQKQAVFAGWDMGPGAGGDDAAAGGLPGGDLGDVGGEPGAEGEEKKPASPLKDLEDKLTQYMTGQVQQRLQKEMRDGPDAKKEPPSSAKQNENMNKQAAVAKYMLGLDALVRTASTDVQLLDNIAMYNQSLGIHIPVEIYRASTKVGSFDRYVNPEAFSRACYRALGRKPNKAETETMVRLGKLVSRREEIRGESDPVLASPKKEVRR